MKEKRSLVRSLKDRLRSRFALSVAETGDQDALTRAEISVALVSSDPRVAAAVLDRAHHLVQEQGRALVVHTLREFH